MKNISLKQMCEYTTTSVFRLGCFVLHEEYDLIKKCNKQKRKTMRHLHFHYLKDIALNAFENRKAKLKEDDKVGN
ncbi:hypothetical protein [Bartonella sp. TT29SHDZB]|uniref:hypothetical protein n=1 Tax=Bartonella sp. TT29SHDZB TaxID=3243581 RepID=UPI0035D097E7